jgi:glutathionylspermidine synthase
MFQYSFGLLDPVVKDDLQFSRLNLLKKCIDASRSSSGRLKDFPGRLDFIWPKSQKSVSAKSGL